MKRTICFLVCLLFLAVPVNAAELPAELADALPREAETVIENTDLSTVDGLIEGVRQILEGVGKQVKRVFRERLRGVAAILLVVVWCGVVECFDQCAGNRVSARTLSMVGTLCITMLSVGSVENLMGLGVETIGELRRFSTVLLPTLAAATAVAGSMATATVHQVTTVLLVDILILFVDGVLVPMTYLYIGVLAASACLQANHLETLADGIKKVLTWILTTALLLFTLYLSVVRIISGAADGASIKVAKTAISGVVPVVGGIIAETAETVLLGANLLKNTIGIGGMLAILAACAYPFLQLGTQYLLYKLTAFFASFLGETKLCKLINGLGGAFGLILGMTGSCALLLMISVLSSLAAVVV